MADEPVKVPGTHTSKFVDNIVPFFVGHRSEIVLVLAGIAAGVRVAFPDNPDIERYIIALDAILLPLGLGFLTARVNRNFFDTTQKAEVAAQKADVAEQKAAVAELKADVTASKVDAVEAVQKSQS